MSITLSIPFTRQGVPKTLYGLSEVWYASPHPVRECFALLPAPRESLMGSLSSRRRTYFQCRIIRHRSQTRQNGHSSSHSPRRSRTSLFLNLSTVGGSRR